MKNFVNKVTRIIQLTRSQVMFRIDYKLTYYSIVNHNNVVAFLGRFLVGHDMSIEMLNNIQTFLIHRHRN